MTANSKRPYKQPTTEINFLSTWSWHKLCFGRPLNSLLSYETWMPYGSYPRKQLNFQEQWQLFVYPFLRAIDYLLTLLENSVKACKTILFNFTLKSRIFRERAVACYFICMVCYLNTLRQFTDSNKTEFSGGEICR